MLVGACRTIFLYVLLMAGMRMMGKRQVGQLQPSELVTTILLSELITAPILDMDIPILASLIPFSILLCFEVIVPYFAARFPSVKRMVDGRPGLVILDGKIDQKQLMELRMSVDELLGLLRLKGVGDLGDVQYGIIEQNGQLSVILRAGAQAITPDDLQIAPCKKGIAHPLVVQGQISDLHLGLLRRDRAWLVRTLAGYGCGVDEVLLFSLDDDGHYHLVKKEDF